MQSGQRLDGRDDGRGIPGRAGSRLGCLRLRCELRRREAIKTHASTATVVDKTG